MRTAWPQVLTLAFIVGTAGAACDDPPAPDPAPTPPGDVITAADGTRFSVEVVAQNLEIPWALAFAPDGRMFFTERPGRVRVFQNGQVLAAPALVLTDVAAVGEGGLLGIAVHPDFASNHFVYLAYTARLAGGSRETRVVRYREVGNTLGEPAVILDRVAAADIHDGARVRFGPDRKLYVTMGDTAAPPTAQDLGDADRQDPAAQRRRQRARRQPARGVADLLLRAPQPAGPRLASRDRRAVGLGARADRQRRNQPAAARAQLRLAGDRGRPDARRDGDADPVLLAVDRAVGGVVLHRHGDHRLPAEPLRRRAAPASTCCASASSRTIRTASPRRSGCSPAASAGSATSSPVPTARSTSAPATATAATTPVAADDRIVRLSAAR